jgi:ketosteroid isomerase-like protein
MGEEMTNETLARDLVERYRQAYEERDVEHLAELFAADAELTWAGGTFRGQKDIRRVLEWDARQSPTAAVTDSGVGIVVAGRTIVWERVVHLAYEGVPFDERAVTVIELDDTGLIAGLRSYYDKLDVLDQIASGSPGVQGRVFRMLTGWLVRQGSKGLDLEPG